MLEGKDSHSVDGLIPIAFLNMLYHNWQRTGPGTTTRGTDQHEAIGFIKVLGSAQSIDYFVGILAGNLGAKLIYLPNAMPASAPPADEDAMLVIRPDGGKPA